MQNDPIKQYHLDVAERVKSYAKNEKLQHARQIFHDELIKTNYAYNFFWLGVPIVQEPQDIQAWQEIIWETKPDLIIETGIAWGGSVIFNASMLALLETCGEIEHGDVIGIDIEIRPHNLNAISKHPMSKKITMFEGSSVDENIISKVATFAANKKRILVILDSNHTHEHVLAELKAYTPMVNVGGYCIVADTGIEDSSDGMKSDRPWGKGNNPKTAVWDFLKQNKNFEIDKNIELKLLLTCAPDGFLKRIAI